MTGAAYLLQTRKHEIPSQAGILKIPAKIFMHHTVCRRIRFPVCFRMMRQPVFVLQLFRCSVHFFRSVHVHAELINILPRERQRHHPCRSAKPARQILRCDPPGFCRTKIDTKPIRADPFRQRFLPVQLQCIHFLPEPEDGIFFGGN